MEGQCKEGPGVEDAEGGRRERPEQVATTRTLLADHVRWNSNSKNVDYREPKRNSSRTMSTSDVRVAAEKHGHIR